MLETTWHLDLDEQRCTVLLPEWSRDIVSRHHWHFDPVNSSIFSSDLGIRLQDLVVNAPAGSEVLAPYKTTRTALQRFGVWDWRTVQLVKRNGPGYCLSRYRYVYQDPSGAWGLWLPVESRLRYFGAFGDEDEAAIAANRLGPRWCPAEFRVERVERRCGHIAPKRPAIAAPTNGTREARSYIEWADGTVERIEILPNGEIGPTHGPLNAIKRDASL